MQNPPNASRVTSSRPRVRAPLGALLLALLLLLTGLPTQIVAHAAAAPATPVRAFAATFQVTYADNVPQEARVAFDAGMAIWAPLLTSAVPIQVRVTWTAGGDCSSTCTLASAGPTNQLQNFPNAPLRDTLYPIALANKLAGTKLNGGEGDNPIDIESNFNSQAKWFYGAGTPPTGQTSFISTAVHELAHGLGFSASLDYKDGVGKFESPPNVFDRFVVNGAGQRLIDTFANNSADLGGQLTGGSIFFDGPNARAAAGGNAPKLFAPNPWQVGSSISHLDQTTYIGGPNTLMTPSDEGGGTSAPGPITEAMFKDLGWTITTSAPVPSAAPLPSDGGDQRRPVGTIKELGTTNTTKPVPSPAPEPSADPSTEGVTE